MRWVAAMGVAAAAAFYVPSLPVTVQMLDTGELVAAAYGLYVPHPPGYPLYVWLQHAAIEMLTGPIFWRAALFNCFCALGVLGIIGSLCGAASLFGLFAVVLPLAFAPVFWRYALLPDVFMLHALLFAALCAIYLRLAATTHRSLLLAALFALGMANHHSMIFAAPLLVHAAIERRSWLAATAMLGCIALIVLSAYASLHLLHPEALYSWGQLDSAADVLRHFLRADYGTLQLDGRGGSVPYGHNLLRVGRALVESMPLSCALMFVPLWRKQLGNVRYRLLLACCAAYILLFFAGANTPDPAILERFFILPLVVIGILTTEAIRTAPLPARTCVGIAVLASVVALLNITQNVQANNLAQETVVEDYALNLLRMIDNNERAVMIVDGDTRLWALRYAQSVLQFKPHVVVLGLGNIFAGQQQKKLQREHPDLQFSPGWPQGRGVFANLVQPNIERYAFYFTRNVNPSNYRVTFMGLGRKITAGSGVATDATSLERLVLRSSAARYEASQERNELKDLYSEYAYYYLKAAQQSPAEQAVAYYTRAVELVPYCFVAWHRLCAYRQSTPCEQEVRALEAAEYDYWH